METTEQTLQMIDRLLRKIAEKFPAGEEATTMTDIHLRVTQDTGELVAFDDEDIEITRSVIEQWIDNKDDNFYKIVANILHKRIEKNHAIIDNMSILKPFAFVLEDDDKENMGELYLADDETVIISPDFMSDLDQDLDNFLKDLMKE